MRLKAPLVRVGTKRRCPKCQWVFEVPTPAEAARRHRDVGEYRVSEGMGRSPVADQPHVTVKCPVCSTLIRAAEDQVGRQVTCPDCDTPVVVPPPAEVEEKKSPSPALGDLGPVEQYAFCEEADDSAPGARPADQTYVGVTCPVCKTFMQVPEDQVGQQIVCPDCRVPMVVRPPAATGQEQGVPAAQLGEYELREEDDASSFGPREVDPTRFSVHCPLCNTLMHAGRDQVGRRMVCGDCETSFVVPPAPEPKRKRDLAAEAGEVYGVGDATEVP